MQKSLVQLAARTVIWRAMAIYIGAVHQVFQDTELLLGGGGHEVLPLLRYGCRTRRRTDFSACLPASRVQKVLFAALAFQHGGQRDPGGLCKSETVNRI